MGSSITETINHMSIFEIDPDIRNAETLSSEFYTSKEFFDQSREKIFARAWQFVGNIGDGDNLSPIEIFDEPLVIAREGRSVRCLSNVCTHRGALVVEKACRATGIRCPYHGRKFGLDGKFLSMPEFQHAANFPAKSDDLVEIPIGFWEKFIFVSLRGSIPLEAFLGDISQHVDISPDLKFSSAKDYQLNAHWALYCENYLEGFHVPFVHPALNSEIDYGTYITETFRYASLQRAWAEPVDSDDKAPPAASYFFVFPNMMFNFYPWGLSINIVRPVSPEKTVVSYLTYVSDESKVGRGAGGDLESVELEDQAIVESVQKGIRSRFYDKGRYSPTREQGTHHFHRLIAEFMS